MATPEQTKETQESKAAPVATQDERLPDIEITIPDEGEGTSETKETTKESGDGQTKQPKKGRFQERINQVTARATEAETTAERLRRENEALKTQLGKTEGDLQTADRAAFNNHAANTEARLAAAKRDLVKAQEDLSGGVDGAAQRIADATAEVSRHASEQSRVDAWKRSHPEPTAEELKARQTQQEEKKQPEQKETQQQYSPELQSFLDRSPWFVPNSGDFDQDMHVVARNFATKLEAKMKKDGTAAEIGSEDYYGKIEQHVRRLFPDYEWSEGEEEEDPKPQQRALPKMNGDQSQVSQRSSSASPGARQAANGNKITLTGEERGFAHQLADGGAYGNVNPATSKPWTHAEAEVRFARQVAKDREIQRQKNGG